ncbi:hypothetical protein ONZ43_g4128 [Nemania bipapillata]|uniref:Uncharacterized protein n=1 Tax=Nemania bipapillata TaxID=110536 RepID=A0ACC2IRE0_9PEZI|nr:hypothetical protein ONZ43_g4128 [Nemania bipapillata]
MPTPLPSHPFVTTFLVANLHCPTCVSSIKDALQGLDGVRWVSPNIITSCVAVDHDPATPIDQMVSKLETAGFEVSSVSSDNGVDPIDDNSGDPEACLSRLRWLRHPYGAVAEGERVRAHLSNCKQCQADVANGKPTIADATLDTARKHLDRDTSEQNSARPSTTSAHSPPVDHDRTSTSGSWRASLAIGGMTCAACANTITRELEKKEHVIKVMVNLVTNSAVVEYLGDKDDISEVVESIEDLGYEAHLDQINAVGEKREKDTARQRTVQIRIDGFYCSHCYDRAASSIAAFRHVVRVGRRPSSSDSLDPILEVTYIPHAPKFTIRHILAAIEASDPAFTASIHHPPTLEEKAKTIQARHQKQILLRALLTFIIAIPTFVIGIVYMSLLPDSNSGKEFLMRPLVSGINRAQIALFILATLVYFFTADVFHRRTIKEIWALWRWRSQTPVLRRLYRFGSMNMLISLGTTIAYISSVAQIIAAGVKHLHMIDNANFYFDSVVFLTLFLLVGRYLEAYSKSKTGNAVEALGKLRPTTAILVEEGILGKTSNNVFSIDMLEFGDTIRVPRGASPPCDGEILQGSTEFDEASLTGESRPIKKTVGDQVFSGTVNQDQIVKIVREGQTKRAPMEKVADTLVAYFVPVITLIAVITCVVWLVIGFTDHELGIKDPIPFSLQFAIAVFVVACPCGLALAAPTAIFVVAKPLKQQVASTASFSIKQAH